MEPKPEEAGASFSVTRFLDHNIRYISYAVVGVGIVGLVRISKSLRITSKFTSVKTIPTEFFTKNFVLYGKVNKVTRVLGMEEFLTILVNHLPIFAIGSKFSDRKTYGNVVRIDSDSDEPLIRILLPAVDIKQEFISQIESRLMDQTIKFTLLHRNENPDFAYALVYFKQYIFRVIPFYKNLGIWCIENGYGCAFPSKDIDLLSKSVKFKNYYIKVLEKEEKAVKKKIGVWKDGELDRWTLFTKWIDKLRRN